jgi:hypothetical protein
MALFALMRAIPPLHTFPYETRKRSEARTREDYMLKRFVIERDIPAVGKMTRPELKGAAETSNAALAKLAPRVQWEHSYVAGDKTFCLYLAENEEAIREHAKLSGFPASKITPITGIIDPTTAAG